MQISCLAIYFFVSFNYCYFPEWFWRLKWETKILKLIQCSMTYKLCFYGASACVSILYSCVKLNPPLVHLHSLAYSTSIESKLHTVFSDKRGLVIEVVNPPNNKMSSSWKYCRKIFWNSFTFPETSIGRVLCTFWKKNSQLLLSAISENPEKGGSLDAHPTADCCSESPCYIELTILYLMMSSYIRS